MNQNILRKIGTVSSYIINYIISFCIFLFVFINAIQLYYKVPLTYTSSLIPFKLNLVVEDLINDFQKVGKRELSSTGQQFVKPEFMRVYRNDVKMAIDDEYIINKTRWIRPTTAHYTNLNLDSNGNPGDILVYMRSTWRTIPDIDLLTPGTNISVESIGSGSVDYKVAENYVFQNDGRYLATSSPSRQLILLIENGDSGYSIIRAVSQLVKA